MGSTGKRAFERKKAKNLKHTASALFPAIEPLPKQSPSPPKPSGQRERLGSLSSLSSSACAEPPRPFSTGRRERAEGSDGRPKTLTGCLNDGVKAGIRPLELLVRARGPPRLFAALWSVGSGVWAQGVRIPRGRRSTGLGRPLTPVSLLCPHLSVL